MIKTYIETRYIKPNNLRYFYVEDASGQENTLSIVKSASGANTITVEYSTDEQNWATLGNTSTAALTYNIPANGRVYLRANANAWGSTYSYNRITASRLYKIGGNIESLLVGSAFDGTQTGSGGISAFEYLFYMSSTLKSAGDLVIPIVTTVNNTFANMFSYCTALTTPPDFSSLTTINVGSMSSTFTGCTALTTPPDLSNVTSVSNRGLQSTFANCTSLASAPDLHNVAGFWNEQELQGTLVGCTQITSVDLSSATSVSGTNRLSMFASGCTSLNSVDIRSITDWNTANTQNWLNNVAPTGTIYINPALDGVIPENSASGIPSGWSKVVVS